MSRKLTGTVRINLRLPEALRRRIERIAAANKHSISNEIVGRVIKSLEREDKEADLEALAEAAANKALDKFLTPGRRAEVEGFRDALKDRENDK
jgi:Arc-like DNA binding domain